MSFETQDLVVGYGQSIVISGLSITIARGEMVTLVGPNGSGKSTILKALARSLKPSAGVVLLDGRDLQTLAPREMARKMAVLPQNPSAPPDITVDELVWHGRYPHQGLLLARSAADREAVAWALRVTGLEELAHRPIGGLSGGERQRVWIAMALAQQPKALLLDEPTTFLDISHQLEVLELLQALNEQSQLTIVMVLHDLNQAARYSRRLIVIERGAVAADGPPSDVLTRELVRRVFGVDSAISADPVTGKPICIPYSLALAQ